MMVPAAEGGEQQSCHHALIMSHTVPDPRQSLTGSLTTNDPYNLKLRLQWLFAAVNGRFPDAVHVLQAWLPAGKVSDNNDFLLCADSTSCILQEASLHDFRAKSCNQPVQFRSSMTGRVWRTGAVQVVQNLRLIPPSMHPRLYLSDSDLSSLGEALYIPVYDGLRPASGPVTVLEALLPAVTRQPVMSADILSFISLALQQLNLSVQSLMPQPIKRSALTGRRARAPVDESSLDMNSGEAVDPVNPAPAPAPATAALEVAPAVAAAGSANTVGMHSAPGHTGEPLEHGFTCQQVAAGHAAEALVDAEVRRRQSLPPASVSTCSAANPSYVSQSMQQHATCGLSIFAPAVKAISCPPAMSAASTQGSVQTTVQHKARRSEEYTAPVCRSQNAPCEVDGQQGSYPQPSSTPTSSVAGAACGSRQHSMHVVPRGCPAYAQHAQHEVMMVASYIPDAYDKLQQPHSHSMQAPSVPESSHEHCEHGPYHKKSQRDVSQHDELSIVPDVRRLRVDCDTDSDDLYSTDCQPRKVRKVGSASDDRGVSGRSMGMVRTKSLFCVQQADSNVHMQQQQ